MCLQMSLERICVGQCNNKTSTHVTQTHGFGVCDRLVNVYIRRRYADEIARQ